MAESSILDVRDRKLNLSSNNLPQSINNFQLFLFIWLVRDHLQQQTLLIPVYYERLMQTLPQEPRENLPSLKVAEKGTGAMPVISPAVGKTNFLEQCLAVHMPAFVLFLFFKDKKRFLNHSATKPKQPPHTLLKRTHSEKSHSQKY